MASGAILSDYLIYSVLYAVTILCNKYILSSLGFHYPTLFQSWQTFVGICLMWLFSDVHLWEFVPLETLSWIPAMLLYVGTIYSGSISLSQLPIPVFLICQSCSDIVFLICNETMPDNFILLSIPAKISAGMMAVLSVYKHSHMNALLWIGIHVVLSGAYRTISYWYSTPSGPYSTLTTTQRLFLNYLFSVLTLMPIAYMLGHHEIAWESFLHFNASKFYIGCILSGILGYAVNKMWNKFAIKATNGSNMLMVHLLAKIITLLMSMNIFPHEHTMQIWLAICLCVTGDLLHIIGLILNKTNLERLNDVDEMHDVLIGS